MVDDGILKQWFCNEVLPLERALMAFLRRHWRNGDDLIDFRQDIYEKLLAAAAEELPQNTKAYLFTTARNHVINMARRQQVVSFELVADLEEIETDYDMFATERQFNARDELRKTQAALETLPLRCQQVIKLKKLDGCSSHEAAEILGVSVSTVEKEITFGMRAITDYLLGGPQKLRRGKLLRRARKEQQS